MDCLYVTRGWGVHDARWTDALRRLGHTPEAVSLEPGADAASAVGDILRKVGPLPVLAGPLTTVTRDLVGISARLVGLSWGYDLHELAESKDTDWLPRLDALLVDSIATRDIAIAAGVPSDRITLLPWGIDLDAFDTDGPAMGGADFGFPTDAQVVVSLRAHEPKYRVNDIVEAFAVVATAVPTARLVIGHSGSNTQALRNLVNALGLTGVVAFIGTVDEDALAPLLRGCACYVTASSVDGTSVTLLQAMACGVPVIASATPGNLGWISPGITGRLFPTGDVHALASAIISCLSTDSTDLTRRADELVRAEADWSRNVAHLGEAMFPTT